MPLQINASLKDVMDKFENLSNMNLINSNIIVRSELPTYGYEGQVCIITSNITDNILLSLFEEDNPNDESIFVFLSKVKNANIVEIGNSLNFDFYFLSVSQGSKKLKSYIYKNNEWKLLTNSEWFILKDGEILNTDVFGNFTKLTSASSTGMSISNGRYKLEINTTSATLNCGFDTLVDLSLHSKYVVKMQDNSNYSHLRSTVSLVVFGEGTDVIASKTIANYDDSVTGTHEFDISEINYKGKLGVQLKTTAASGRQFFITEMYIV